MKILYTPLMIVPTVTPEQRVFDRQPVVAHERKLQPAADAVPVDPRDEELVHSLDRGHRVFPSDEVGQRQLSGGERLEVDAGLERPARAGHDDHAHATPGGDRRDRLAELCGKARIARVQHFRPVERHAGDRAPHVQADRRLMGHGALVVP